MLDKEQRRDRGKGQTIFHRPVAWSSDGRGKEGTITLLSDSDEQGHLPAMFVGIVGPTCSGKHEVMNLMASFYGFTRLYLRVPAASSHDTSDTKSIRSNGQWISPSRHKAQPFLEFDTISEMLDHVTLNWMDHFVTCGVHTVGDIAILRKRPFFLLLSVESPIMIRFRRCVSR